MYTSILSLASTLIKCQFHSHLSSIKENATITNFSTVHTLRYEGKGRKHAITNFPLKKPHENGLKIDN